MVRLDKKRRMVRICRGFFVKIRMIRASIKGLVDDLRYIKISVVGGIFILKWVG